MALDTKQILGVVGPCGAGKTTLVKALQQQGYHVRHIAQEHSYVPHMWKRIAHPDILIYLYASYPTATLRRKLDWTEAEYEEQLRRLNHARQHADLVINTDHLSSQEVLGAVLGFLGIVDE